MQEDGTNPIFPAPVGQLHRRLPMLDTAGANALFIGTNTSTGVIVGKGLSIKQVVLTYSASITINAQQGTSSSSRRPTGSFSPLPWQAMRK